MSSPSSIRTLTRHWKQSGSEYRWDLSELKGLCVSVCVATHMLDVNSPILRVNHPWQGTAAASLACRSHPPTLSDSLTDFNWHSAPTDKSLLPHCWYTPHNSQTQNVKANTQSAALPLLFVFSITAHGKIIPLEMVPPELEELIIAQV